MSAHFYYMRNKGNHPVVTICLLLEKGILSKGVAICSPLDQPKKHLGRAIAYGRAVKAMKSKSSSEKINRPIALKTARSAFRSVRQPIHFYVFPYGHKSIYNDHSLQGVETRILSGTKEQVT